MPVEDWAFSKEYIWRTDGANPLAPRDLLVYGTYIPDWSTTGHSGTLDQIGNITTSYDGQVIENLDVYGTIRIRHSNVTVRNCSIRGLMNTNPTFQIRVFPAGPNNTALNPVARVVDCTIWGPDGVDAYSSGNASLGRNTIWERCNMYGTTDGLGMTYANNYMLGCWVHDLRWFADDPGHSDGSHSDGVQLHGGGGNNYIFGNLIEMGYHGNAAIMMGQESPGPYTGEGYGSAHIEKNWFRSTYPVQADACAVAVNISEHQQSPKYAMPNFSLIDNQFSAQNTWRVNYHALISHRTYDDALANGRLYGNVVEGTNIPARIGRINTP